MEHRFAQLTKGQFPKNSRRFENMLMTTRRTPIVGGYGSAATLRVINPAGASLARTSFFSRQFSTQEPLFHYLPAKTKLFTERLLTKGRLAETELVALSSMGSSRIHRFLKGKAIQKSRSQQFQTQDTVSLGTLDIRDVRLKSSRNAEYLQRLYSTPTRAFKVFTKKGPSAFSGTSAFRTGRRNVYLFKKKSNRFAKTGLFTAALNSRFTITTRRLPTVLMARKTTFLKAPVLACRRLFTRFRRSRKYNMKRLLITAQTSGAARVSESITSTRSILRYRNASARVPYVYYTAPTFVRSRAVQLKAST